MTKPTSSFAAFIEKVIPVVVLVVVMMYTGALFFQVPYAGINWESNGRIFEIYVPAEGDNSLQLNDHLVEVGSIKWSDFRQDSRLPVFAGYQAGQTMPIQILRNGELRTILWNFPGFNLTEIAARLNSEWWLAYVFWVAGTGVLLVVRPRDVRWRMLILFFYLTALWLAIGIVSRWHILESAILLRAAIWVSVPIYWHLHWVFPKSPGQVPGWAFGSLYFVAGGLALAEWFQWLPRGTYNYGFLLAVIGSAVLLLGHYRKHPNDQRVIRFIMLSVVLASIFPIISTGWSTFTPTSQVIHGGSLLTLPLIPLAYFYAAYRRQLGGLEIRANQVVSIYLFVALLGSAIIMFVVGASVWLNLPGAAILIDLLSAGSAALAGIFLFSPFQRIVEKWFLGMPLPPARILESYSKRIMVSLDEEKLSQLLTQEILRSMLITQSALLRVDGGEIYVVYAQNVENNQLPNPADLVSLLARASQYRPPVHDISVPYSQAWVRLALAFSFENKLGSVWLLGRRDPDDYYSQREIEVLSSLGNQTAIALINIVYAERLRALYQNDVDQREVERTSLARDLHDGALQELKLLRDSIASENATEEFVRRYDAASSSLRQTIADLRPAMLNFGLRPALAGLADDLSDRCQEGEEILFEIPNQDTPVLHREQVVLHLYRIVQQACENGLRHAHATRIVISGQITMDKINLTIEDDGVGFEVGDKLDLAQLVSHKHFGLAGMHERALLVGATLKIESKPGHGMKIHILWEGSGPMPEGSTG